MVNEFHGNFQDGKLYLKLRSNDGYQERWTCKVDL